MTLLLLAFFGYGIYSVHISNKLNSRTREKHLASVTNAALQKQLWWMWFGIIKNEIDEYEKTHGNKACLEVFDFIVGLFEKFNIPLYLTSPSIQSSTNLEQSRNSSQCEWNYSEYMTIDGRYNMLSYINGIFGYYDRVNERFVAHPEIEPPLYKRCLKNKQICRLIYSLCNSLTQRSLAKYGYCNSTFQNKDSDWQEWEKNAKQISENKVAYPWLYR